MGSAQRRRSVIYDCLVGYMWRVANSRERQASVNNSDPAGRIYRPADGIRAAVAAMSRHRHAASGPTEDRFKHL